MKNPPFKIFIFLTSLVAVLFPVLYFSLSVHSRISGDDFFYLWLTNTFGAWDGMVHQYNVWSGRWSAHYIGCLLISQWKSPFFLPFINIATIALLYFSISNILLKIILILKIQTVRLLFPVFTIILITSFFFLSYNIGETWFWYIIILTYLWSIIAFLFIVNIFLSNRNNFLEYFLLTILSLYIGGASESYAIIFISILFILLLFRLKFTDSKLLSPFNKKIAFTLFIILTSFTFAILAPGTEIRHSLLPQTVLSDKIWIALKSFLKYFIRYLPAKAVDIILFTSPWLLFGAYFLKNSLDKKSVGKYFKNTTYIFLSGLFIMFIPTAFIMSETGPDRALSIVSIFTAIYFAIVFSIAGIYINFDKSSVKISLSGILAISISILIYDLVNQNRITTVFAKAVDERLLKIEHAKSEKFNGILQLKKIPSKGMLYWDELSTDTSFYTNKHLQNGLGLSFPVMLKDD